MADPRTYPPQERDPRSSLSKPTGPRRFKPDLKWTLVTLVMLSMLIGLGTWQVNRYFETSSEHVLYHKQHYESAPVTSFKEFQGTDRLEALRWRRVELSGTLDAKAIEILAARYKFGQLGYGVMAPLKLAEKGSKPEKVLIYMGWVPKNRLDEYKTALESNAGKTMVIKGRIEPVYSDTNTAEYAPVISQDNIEVWRSPSPAALAVRNPGLDPDLLVFSGEEAKGETVDIGQIPLDGYPPQPRLMPSKHIEYFMTWYGAGLALICVWVALSFRREHEDKPFRGEDDHRLNKAT